MRKVTFVVFLSLFVCGIVESFAQHVGELQVVACVTPSDKLAVFTSLGVGEKKKELVGDAKRRLFYALLYKGVQGINDGQPLLEQENVSLTAPFFDGSQAYEAYIIETSEIKEADKRNGKFYATYSFSVSMKLLTDFLKRNGLMGDVKSFGASDGPIMPTIIVVPYKKTGENYKSILEKDFDRRLAVSNVQDGFRSRNVSTMDLVALIRGTERRTAYENNQSVADSNDKQLLLSSGADVYVEVDLIKDSNAEGNKVSLIMKAFESATGTILASKDAITRRYPTASVDVLTKYAVRDELKSFLDDICSQWEKPGKLSGEGTRVVLQFAIAGSSSMTFNEKVGTHSYSLANVIRQWVRKNCHKAQYHLKGVMDESIIFDSVTMPPTDEDGLPMDAAQFAFLLEVYLKEQNGVDCSSRIEGNNIMFTIN